MKDRFDLEDEIGELYSFADQLKNLSEGILEHNLTNEDVVNALLGMKVMVYIHAQKLTDTMSQCFGLDDYRDELEQKIAH